MLWREWIFFSLLHELMCGFPYIKMRPVGGLTTKSDTAVP